MGLLDQILGNVLGGAMGGGAMAPAPRQGRAGMSPITKALLALLAAKAFQHYRSTQAGQGRPDLAGRGQGGPMGGGGPMQGGGPFGDLGGALDPRGGPAVGRGQGGPMGSGMGRAPAPGGGMGDMGGLGGLLGGGLGGLLGGLAGSGGLGAIVDQFRRSGYGDAVDSWVGTGQNRHLAPGELESALGPDTLDELQRETGLPRDEMLNELSDVLPDTVDSFTPEGRLPTEDELGRWV